MENSIYDQSYINKVVEVEGMRISGEETSHIGKWSTINKIRKPLVEKSICGQTIDLEAQAHFC